MDHSKGTGVAPGLSPGGSAMIEEVPVALEVVPEVALEVGLGVEARLGILCGCLTRLLKVY